MAVSTIALVINGNDQCWATVVSQHNIGILQAGRSWVDHRCSVGCDAQTVPGGVRAHNAAAIARYHKYGFAEEGRRPQQYRRAGGELWDAIVMGLAL